MTLPEAVPLEALRQFEDSEEAERLAERLRQLAADEILVHDLQWDGFAGPRWDALAHALVEYGYQVILAWIVSGVIFSKCREKGLQGASLGPHLMERAVRDAAELAWDVVGEGIVGFREEVLKRRIWRADRGASLKTFFVGQCLIKFVGVLRVWRKAIGRLEMPVQVVVDDRSAFARAPDEVAIARSRVGELLRDISDPILRSILILSAASYPYEQIADMLDLNSAKAVEARLYRYRRTLRAVSSDA